VGKTDTAAARGNAATNRGRIAEPGRRGNPHSPALALANGTGGPAALVGSASFGAAPRRRRASP
jgi:hypothetical protein